MTEVHPSIQVPEVERVLHSIQYMYADAVGALLVDKELKWVIAFAGAVFISPLTSRVGGEPSTANASKVILPALGFSISTIV
jgi:hypothetical protein